MTDTGSQHGVGKHELRTEVSTMSDERAFALNLATQLHLNWYLAEGGDPHKVTATATVLWAWLTGPVKLVITAGPTIDQTTGQPTGKPGGTIMASLKDSQKFELTVGAEDAKNQATTPPTDVTYTSADTTIITITGPDADGKTWAVAGNPGSTVITGDWPDSPTGDVQGTIAVDVTAGDATSLSITAGTPVAQ